jgi:hypothetical protein
MADHVLCCNSYRLGLAYQRRLQEQPSRCPSSTLLHTEMALVRAASHTEDLIIGLDLARFGQAKKELEKAKEVAEQKLGDQGLRLRVSSFACALTLALGSVGGGQ